MLAAGSSALAVSDPGEMLPDARAEARAEAIGHQLRCLVCQNESVEESEADIARDLRKRIREHIAAGDSDAQIMAWMQQRYGDFVRLNPPFKPVTLLLWGSPVLALGAGAAAVLVARRRRPLEAKPLSREEQARLAELLARR